MLTVTLTEPMVNAVRAALDMRRVQMARTLARLQDHPESASRDYSIECVETALRDATTAALVIDAAMDEPEFPADMTLGRLDEWTSGELAGGWGK